MKCLRPWYRWHWLRYRSSERVLNFRSLAVHGAYQNLIAAAWQQGGSLPNDRNLLWKLALAGSPEEYESVADEVEGMFKVSADGKRLTHETIEEEWDSTSSFLDQRSAAGKASGEARRNKRANGCSTDVTDTTNESRTISTSINKSNTETIDGSLAFETSMALYHPKRRDYSQYAQNRYFEAIGEIREQFNCSDTDAIAKFDDRVKKYVAAEGEYCSKFVTWLDSKPWKAVSPSAKKYIPSETDEQAEARIREENRKRRQRGNVQ